MRNKSIWAVGGGNAPLLRFFLPLLPAFHTSLSFCLPDVLPHGSLGPVCVVELPLLLLTSGDGALGGAMHLCEAVDVP